VPELVAAQAWNTPEFAVETADPLIDVAVDGEPQRLPSPLRIGVLRVRLPPGRPRHFSGGYGPEGGSGGPCALLRVLTGRSPRG